VNFLTDFADQAVILPMVLAVSGVLAAEGWRRGAAAWLAAIAGTSAMMLALKLAFLSCSPVFGPADMRSPSGHAAVAAVVAGGLAALLLRGRPASVLPVAVLAGVVIGISRLALGVHSLPEVVLGALVGWPARPRWLGWRDRCRRDCRCVAWSRRWYWSRRCSMGCICRPRQPSGTPRSMLAGFFRPARQRVRLRPPIGPWLRHGRIGDLRRRVPPPMADEGAARRQLRP